MAMVPSSSCVVVCSAFCAVVCSAFFCSAFVLSGSVSHDQAFVGYSESFLDIFQSGSGFGFPVSVQDLLLMENFSSLSLFQMENFWCSRPPTGYCFLSSCRTDLLISLALLPPLLLPLLVCLEPCVVGIRCL
jgi:hypothetical protein